MGEQVGGITASIIYDGTLFAALFGLHYKNETDSKGNTTRYAFNAATLKQSTVAWKNSSAGLFVSTDAGYFAVVSEDGLGFSDKSESSTIQK